MDENSELFGVDLDLPRSCLPLISSLQNMVWQIEMNNYKHS